MRNVTINYGILFTGIIYWIKCIIAMHRRVTASPYPAYKIRLERTLRHGKRPFNPF